MSQTVDTLHDAARRLHERGEYDLADLLRDLGVTVKACLASGSPLDGLPFVESARAVAQSVLSEQDATRAEGRCASSAADPNTASCGEVRAGLTAAECFRLAHEHTHATLNLGIDRAMIARHRAAAGHYLAQACAMAAAQYQGVL
jgi:hypothetical protein